MIAIDKLRQIDALGWYPQLGGTALKLTPPDDRPQIGGTALKLAVRFVKLTPSAGTLKLVALPSN